MGNRTASHNESNYSYDPFNQLVGTANLWAYTYDLNGNQLSKLDGGGHYDEWHYTWDFENRLTQVQVPFGESVSYSYDALGRRVQRSSTVSGETTQSTYDGQEVILDTLSTGNTVEYLNGPGVDNKLSVNHSQWGVFYLLHDQLGSTRVVTDATGGAIDHASTDSFGNGTASGVTRYAYTGREWDEDAGLYYYRARWYDAQQGRFLSEDPIGLEGGINLYAYVENNPLNLIDPSGLSVVAFFDRVQGRMIVLDIGGTPGGPLIKSYEFTGLFSGDGDCKNKTTCDAVKDEGPVPAGGYLIGTARNPPWLNGHRGFPLYQEDGQGGYTLGYVNRRDPFTGATAPRGGYYLHAGSLSLGCVTFPSQAARGTPEYPSSDMFNKLDGILSGTPPLIRRSQRNGRDERYTGSLVVF